MAKTTYAKLGLAKIPTKETKTIMYEDNPIEILQYLPFEEKLNLVSEIVNNSYDEDSDIYNCAKIKLYTELFIIFTYTDIGFTDKQKEDLFKIYDSFVVSGLLNEILAEIPEAELMTISQLVKDTIVALYAYKNSFAGNVAALTHSFDNLPNDVNELAAQIQNPENLELVRTIIDKLG